MLTHKMNLGKFKKIEIISSIFSDHTAMRFRNKLQEKKTWRNANTGWLNNKLLNNHWITGEIKEEIKNYLETNENKSITVQNLMGTANAILRGKFMAIQSYLKKQEKSQIDNLFLHLKQPEKEEQTKAKGSRRKEIIKIRAEIK